MTTNSYRPNIDKHLPGSRLSRGMAFGVLIITALFFFEIFNYSTTDYALSDLLGELSFAGMRWATILAIAFCGIDFAGIARLFAPDQGNNRNESWFLFGAWLLAATMNAMLTWWGVSLAILNHQAMGEAVVARETLLRVVPVFVAVLVWLIRVMIIGAFSVAGDRLFNADTIVKPVYNRHRPLLDMESEPVKSSAARPAPAQLNKSRPMSGGSISRVPAAARPKPAANNRYSNIPPEPDYIDDDEHGYGETNYSRAPLAAQPSDRQSNTAMISEPQTTRTSTPRR